MPLHLLLAVSLSALPSRAEPTLRERARAQDFSSLPILREALEGADQSARVEAAFALGQLGLAEFPEGEPEPADAAPTRVAAAQVLIPAVSDPDPALRRAAVEALGKVAGADSEPFLLSAATDYDPGVRGEAALALFRMRLLKRVPEYSTAAVSRLTLLASDPEPEVRWRAVYAFSRWPEPRALKALSSAQSDADARARLFAVRALGKLPAEPSAALLSDPDAYVRAETVSALAASKAWGKIPDAAFSDPSAHVRAAAADAAAESRDAARFGPLVAKLLSDPGTLVSGRAVIALARLRGDAAALDVERARRDPRWWLRARAYEAAALLPDAARVLREGVADADPRVASQALDLLPAASTAAAAEVLDGVLRDSAAPLELVGSAADAAAERPAPELVDGLLSALARAKGPGSSELRDDLRQALRKAAARNPSRADEISRALKKHPVFDDKPRRLRPLKNAAAAVFETERGSFTIVLASGEDAGVHGAAFTDSVKRGLYDGLIWHRVVTAFVVQGGDPRGSGWGDAGWRLADEINRLPFERGTVGMPKAGKDTGGCQLFVSLVPTPHLDGRYTAFGKVTEGLDVLDRLEPGDKILRARLR